MTIKSKRNPITCHVIEICCSNLYRQSAIVGHMEPDASNKFPRWRRHCVQINATILIGQCVVVDAILDAGIVYVEFFVTDVAIVG